MSRRQRDACDAYAHWVHERRARMHPDDMVTEPANFANWCAICEDDTREFLVTAEARVRATINAACNDPSAVTYVEGRRFFHRYIVGALQRRFGIDCPALDVEEEIPF